jgi:medium-chain acyl-[acyl-carrier-protein] hydrolase
MPPPGPQLQPVTIPKPSQAEGMWLRREPASRDAAVRLVCAGHAGSGASHFNSWQAHLPSWIELIKVQLPGREDRYRDEPLRRVEAAILPLLAELEPLLDRPLVIYGHSMGALIAFELTRTLRRRGLPPPLALFVSGRRAPQRPLVRTPLYQLPDDELIALLAELGGTPSQLIGSAKWLARFLPVIRADLEISDEYTYVAEPPLECPLHAFLGTADELIDRKDWESWSDQAGQRFTRELIPGGAHVFSGAPQRELVARIVAALRRCDPDNSPRLRRVCGEPATP